MTDTHNETAKMTPALRSRQSTRLCRGWHAALAASAALIASASAHAVPRGPDFNGDGLSDAAVGAPFSTVAGKVAAGVVHVLSHSAAATSPPRLLEGPVLRQGSAGVPSTPNDFGHFGLRMAWGDFDNDQFDDLAVYVWEQDLGQSAIQLFRGSSSGLIAGPLFPTFAQDQAELAAGDFNADGFDDLVVSLTSREQVTVYFGAAGGLQTTQVSVYTPFSLNFSEPSTHGSSYIRFSKSKFGHSLSTGDFDCDGVMDLAIGAPDAGLHTCAETQPGVVSCTGPTVGAVVIAYGAARSTTFNLGRTQAWHQNSSGVEGVAEEGDRFGAALAAGKFNGTNCSGLAIGVPGEAIGSLAGAGAVNLLTGSRAGLTTAFTTLLHQDVEDVRETAEAGDNYGAALSISNLDTNSAPGWGPGYDELIVGIPGENQNTGALNVFRGTMFGLTTSDNAFWGQNNFGASAPVPNWGFGSVLGGSGDNIVLAGAPGNGFDQTGIAYWSSVSGGPSFLVRAVGRHPQAVMPSGVSRIGYGESITEPRRHAMLSIR